MMRHDRGDAGSACICRARQEIAPPLVDRPHDCADPLPARCRLVPVASGGCVGAGRHHRRGSVDHASGRPVGGVALAAVCVVDQLRRAGLLLVRRASNAGLRAAVRPPGQGARHGAARPAVLPRRPAASRLQADLIGGRRRARGCAARGVDAGVARDRDSARRGVGCGRVVRGDVAARVVAGRAGPGRRCSVDVHGRPGVGGGDGAGRCDKGPVGAGRGSSVDRGGGRARCGAVPAGVVAQRRDRRYRWRSQRARPVRDPGPTRRARPLRGGQRPVLLLLLESAHARRARGGRAARPVRSRGGVAAVRTGVGPGWPLPRPVWGCTRCPAVSPARGGSWCWSW